MERNGYARRLGANMEPKRLKKGAKDQTVTPILGTFLDPGADFSGTFLLKDVRAPSRNDLYEILEPKMLPK